MKEVRALVKLSKSEPWTIEYLKLDEVQDLCGIDEYYIDENMVVVYDTKAVLRKEEVTLRISKNVWARGPVAFVGAGNSYESIDDEQIAFVLKEYGM